MIKAILTRLLNHLITQNAWAREQLLPYAGKSVRFAIPPVEATLTVLEDGGLAMAGESSDIDAGIQMPLSVALRLLTGDEHAATLVTLEGDTELATAIAKILRGLHWEYEEDLSRVIGDAPAHELAEAGRKVASEVKKQSTNLVDMLVEYWQEEQPMIAKKRHVANFVTEVDTLRDDTERLQKRLELLEARRAAVTPADTTNPS